jgi:hypothetical protein
VLPTYPESPKRAIGLPDAKTTFDTAQAATMALVLIDIPGLQQNLPGERCPVALPRQHTQTRGAKLARRAAEAFSWKILHT